MPFRRINEDARRKFIRDIAMAFSGTDFAENRDPDGIELVWERNDLSARAAVNAQEAWEDQ